MTTSITTQRDLLDLVNRVECAGCDYVDEPPAEIPAKYQTVEGALEGFYGGFRECGPYSNRPASDPRLIIVAQEPLFGGDHADLDDSAWKSSGKLLTPGRWEYVVDAALIEALGL